MKKYEFTGETKENLIEQVGNVHQGLAAILKFLS